MLRKEPLIKHYRLLIWTCLHCHKYNITATNEEEDVEDNNEWQYVSPPGVTKVRAMDTHAFILFFHNIEIIYCFCHTRLAFLRHDINPEYRIKLSYTIFIFCTIILNQIKIVPNMHLNYQLQHTKGFQFKSNPDQWYFNDSLVLYSI